ncbi:PE-PGRS family protein [Streptomyces sp. NPDC091281]|uniref:PE-PGRS family protein n=1 Tax=Streptomyces sp. NPDC091281 TaxID=3365985 RepID=UPI003804C5FC
MTAGRDDLRALLRHAGLDVVAGEGAVGSKAVSPSAAWRMVVAAGTEPAVRVRADRPDVITELNARWLALATRTEPASADGAGIVGEGGEFLIDVAGDWTHGGERRWTRVRLAEGWDLAGVLGERPGGPEFVTLAPDGNALLGMVCGSDEVRLVSVPDLPARREAEARAAVRETPRQRADAWDSLASGPVPSPELREQWASGLATNEALPEELLVPLLGRSHLLLWRPLPAAVVEAALVHPDPTVQDLLADAQTNLTGPQWARLILGARDERHRWIYTWSAADRGAVLPAEVCERLAADPSARVREQAARLPGPPGLSGLSAATLTALASDGAARVRAEVCRTAWADLRPEDRRALLDDADGTVREEALFRHHRDRPVSRSVFRAMVGDGDGASPDGAARGSWTDHGGTVPAGAKEIRVLSGLRLERAVAEEAVRHADPARRRALAGNRHLDADLVAVLASDPDAAVRSAVAVRHDLTEEQRALIQVDFDPRGYHYTLDWVGKLHTDADAMRGLAASSHPLIRRSVARARRLPPDVVALLARDEDRVVQLFLAESCDDAPAEMLLRVWRWWTGSLSVPDRPRGHPNFPREGLLRYADDPSPRMRRLAPDDPASTADHVERCGRDDAEEVRRRAAKDPRLTPASALRLLDDPSRRVRCAVAAGHPALPAGVTVRLLRDTDTAQDAARNPALPVPVMEQILRLLGAPLPRERDAPGPDQMTSPVSPRTPE